MLQSYDPGQLATQLRLAFAETIAAKDSLEEYLTQTNSRAVGLWKIRDSDLCLLSFCPHATMPSDVATEFAKATARVSLDQTELGIVKAAVTGEPAVAKRIADGGRLHGSATWLDRFHAVQSLAAPIHRNGFVVGVLAMSTDYYFQETHESWQLTLKLAMLLGETG